MTRDKNIIAFQLYWFLIFGPLPLTHDHNGTELLVRNPGIQVHLRIGGFLGSSASMVISTSSPDQKVIVKSCAASPQFLTRGKPDR